MKTYKVKLYDHEGLSEKKWKLRFKAVNRKLQKVHKDKEFVFTVVPTKFKGIEWRTKQLKKSEKDNKWKTVYRVSYNWFKWSFTVYSYGYDFCVAHFSEKQYEGDVNKARGESLAFNFGIGEIVTAKSGGANDWADHFLHEVSHTMFDFIMKVEDVTHRVHYTKGLTALLQLWQ